MIDVVGPREARERSRVKRLQAEGKPQPDPEIVEQLTGMFSKEVIRDER